MPTMGVFIPESPHTRQTIRMWAGVSIAWVVGKALVTEKAVSRYEKARISWLADGTPLEDQWERGDYPEPYRTYFGRLDGLYALLAKVSAYRPEPGDGNG